MGPNRDAVWSETGILDAFPANGPKVLWRVPIGGGYSGPAVAGGKVFVADKILKGGAKDPANLFDTKTKVEATERVLCFDAKTGKEIWKHEYACPYQVSYPAGPRCTPTVSGGKVYTLGAMGDLLCLDAEKGKVIWQKNFPKDYAAKVPIWGFAAHPLVYKNLLICLVGGDGSVVVAFDKETGKEVWKNLSAPEPGYCPPTLIEVGGKPQLIIWHSTKINGLNPETGSLYWSEPLKPNSGMSIMAPRKEGDYLYAGGNGGCQAVLKLSETKPEATIVWQQDAVPQGKKAGPLGMAPINMTPFIEGGVIYGVDQPGMFRAVELKTGKRLWYSFMPVIGKDEDEEYKQAATGTAFVIKHADRFFLFAETGDLIIAKLSPKGYEEIGRARLLDPTGPSFGRKVVWSYPAFAEKCVFARNDKEIVCVSLAKE
ncbi:PQQ-binding-like beta-propeller repeat protein [Fimbriiglobus ruber]|uniref:PQQ-binding-like beta-propeller repeat protein n=1 Tax=Fimbriiglobus ruber TaxID=1908690 RepID=UPI000B4AE9DB|nr:PQQ-binding-like beta-propeller repeat protein [Fimbriiglobus ruber]